MFRTILYLAVALIALTLAPQVAAFVPSLPLQRCNQVLGRQTPLRVLHENEVPNEEGTKSAKNLWSGMKWNGETEQWEQNLAPEADEQLGLDAAAVSHVHEVQLEHSTPMSAQESVLLYLQKTVDAANETPDEVSM
mmetsp:Transcript_8969/g.33825  ORF Transcript_8969/g.33825 Transcript_8969/m.33825 type:complete len:136 (-) Transcript_8969:223-630(-)